jgi:hypothetical protein
MMKMSKPYMKYARRVILILLFGLLTVLGLALAHNPPTQELSGLFI